MSRRLKNYVEYGEVMTKLQFEVAEAFLLGKFLVIEEFIRFSPIKFSFLFFNQLKNLIDLWEIFL